MIFNIVYIVINFFLFQYNFDIHYHFYILRFPYPQKSAMKAKKRRNTAVK